MERPRTLKSRYLLLLAAKGASSLVSIIIPEKEEAKPEKERNATADSVDLSWIWLGGFLN